MNIDMDDFKEKRKHLVSAPVLGHMYLLIKVHKKNFPGRAVVSQIDDPTYKICKILTDILNPLTEKGDSYIQNSYDLKKTLAGIKIDEKTFKRHLMWSHSTKVSQLRKHFIASKKN